MNKKNLQKIVYSHIFQKISPENHQVLVYICSRAVYQACGRLETRPVLTCETRRGFTIFVTRVVMAVPHDRDALFTMESAIRGYHIYKDIWNSTVGEQLDHHREADNIYNMYAVSVIKPGI